jgi:hypothetical protein
MTLKAGLIININKTKYLPCTRKSIQQKYLIAGGERHEHVNWIKYLGIMVNTGNSIEEEIKERIAAGNRAYHVHKKLLLIQTNIPQCQITTLYNRYTPSSNLCFRNTGTQGK